MTADERALLAAVCADPDSDLPRLVYADWLDDHGRAERAELIRLQVRGVGSDRVRELIDHHGREWRDEMPTADGRLRWDEFRHGFPEHLRVHLVGPDLTRLFDGLAEAASLAPVRVMVVHVGSFAALGQLLAATVVSLTSLLLLKEQLVDEPVGTEPQDQERERRGQAFRRCLADVTWGIKPETVVLNWDVGGWSDEDWLALTSRPGPVFRARRLWDDERMQRLSRLTRGRWMFR